MSRKLLILNLYGILVDGGYRNEEIRQANKGKPLGASVHANRAQIDHYNFQVEHLILQEIAKRKTGQIILEGIRSSGWSVVVRDMWSAGDTCNSTTLGTPEMYRGIVNVTVGFSPDSSCHVNPKNGIYPPGGSREESLFHELVHAFRLVTEKASMRRLSVNPFVPGKLRKLPNYEFEEDFFAILISNIFSSETGRPLRGGHDSLDPLPRELSTDKGFLAVEEYARLVRRFCTDHRAVSMHLRDVPSAFNPIRGILVGQGFQHLLNAQ
jgi:hypothetical protein